MWRLALSAEQRKEAYTIIVIVRREEHNSHVIIPSTKYNLNVSSTQRAIVCCPPVFCFNRSTSDASGAFAAGISNLFVLSFLLVLESPLNPT